MKIKKKPVKFFKEGNLLTKIIWLDNIAHKYMVGKITLRIFIWSATNSSLKYVNTHCTQSNFIYATLAHHFGSYLLYTTLVSTLYVSEMLLKTKLPIGSLSRLLLLVGLATTFVFFSIHVSGIFSPQKNTDRLDEDRFKLRLESLEQEKEVINSKLAELGFVVGNSSFVLHLNEFWHFTLIC